MERNEMARLYAGFAKNLARGWFEAGSLMFAANRRLVDAARAWGDEARAAELASWTASSASSTPTSTP